MFALAPEAPDGQMSATTDAANPEDLAANKPTITGLILRIGLFALLGWLTLMTLGFLLYPFGVLVASTLSTFGAAAVANAVTVRIFERGTLSDLGLGWSRTAKREFLLGVGSGISAAAMVLGLPLLFRIAHFEPAPAVDHPWAGFFFVSLILLFGATGEEMLFHGYGFQLLLRSTSPFATILPVSVLFGAAHWFNPNATLGSAINTALWGVLLGWAYYRTGALWLSIGLHYGWNFTLPLFGENLSGFTMGVTGHTLRWSIGDLWSGGAYGPEGGILTTLVVIVLFLALLRFSRNEGA
jgi:membrane protease YdiL (CAAX protease family)